ncbi:MAG: CDP-diacylglycerol--glycerol-3-phosphate 3-phosphatidyltransferase [Clostridiales bacterium]|nr:CDP-diacylglycerol--glycerol-3-phosphate 3-phosphatidyltransferase [Clostridiales bacterium]
MNLPNKITIARILLIPLFMVTLLSRIPYGGEIAAFIFIIAALTDSLDGYIARKNKMITNFGKFMDPLADKLLISAALISLVEMGEISAWVAFIIIGRELTISILRAVAAAEGLVIAASWWGKVKTFTQVTAIIIILLGNFPFSLIGVPLDDIVLGIAVIVTIISGMDYLKINRHILNGK